MTVEKRTGTGFSAALLIRRAISSAASLSLDRQVAAAQVELADGLGIKPTAGLPRT